MQPSTPPRQFSSRVNGHGILAIPVDRDYPKQFDGQLSLSAPDTRPHRSTHASVRHGRRLALDHGSV